MGKTTGVILTTTAVLCSGAVCRSEDFVLKGKVREAIEGGPVIITLELAYHGKTTIVGVAGNPPGLNPGGQTPAGWSERPPPPAGEIGSFLPQDKGKIEPGEFMSRTVYLHHDFAKIPRGKVEVKIGCSVSVRDGEDSKRIASPSTTLEVDVQPADEAQLSSIRKRMDLLLEQRDQDKLGYRTEDALADELLWVKHEALLPVAFRLLEPRGSQYPPHDDFRPYLYEWSTESDAVHGALVLYLRNRGGRGDWFFFSKWRRAKVKLTDMEIDTLLEARDPWIRAYTCSYFPDQCSDAARESLRNESEALREFLERSKK